MIILLLFAGVFLLLFSNKKEKYKDDAIEEYKKDKIITKEESFERTQTPSYISVCIANQGYSVKQRQETIDTQKAKNEAHKFKRGFSKVLEDKEEQRREQHKKDQQTYGETSQVLSHHADDERLVDQDGQVIKPEIFNKELDDVASLFKNETQLESGIETDIKLEKSSASKVVVNEKKDLMYK